MAVGVAGNESDTLVITMCRSIKPLFNFDPPVSAEEIRAASLQFVRKISGYHKPSKANEPAFLAAVEEIAGISARLLRSLETNAPPKNRKEEEARARARAAGRYGAGGAGETARSPAVSASKDSPSGRSAPD